MTEKATVYLKEVVEHLEMTGDGWFHFLNIKTGEFVSYSNDYYDGDVDPEELFESDDYLVLPSQFDIHEYNIMRAFADEVNDSRKQELLYIALNGKGAFRRFKDTLIHMDLREEWFAYREKALLDIARKWCEENDVEYRIKG